MANGKTHMLAGGMLVTGLYIVDKKLIRKEELKFDELVGSFLLGLVGGAMADLLEPAINPNHRKFFHSIIWAGVMFFGKESLCELLNLDNDGRKRLDWFIASYGSHLALDLCTPKGLPIF